MYRAYQDEYAEAYERATQLVELLEQSRDSGKQIASDSERIRYVSNANQALHDVDSVLKAMELESRTNPTLRMEVRPLRPKLQELQKRFNASLAQLNRENLLGDALLQQDIRRRLQSTNDTLEKDSCVIDKSSKVALETEVIGQGILRDLLSQRETLQRSRNNMQRVNEELDTSNAQVTDIENANKCCIQ
eukprot:GEMP01054712.1.p1 GENE.GEMP01054712.1~~GEMP01054712.1.p1  ORF type:complete len:190 (+),score=42.24 GEMP01054712.1:20-589(+)